jgi:hypothetical protein
VPQTSHSTSSSSFFASPSDHWRRRRRASGENRLKLHEEHDNDDQNPLHRPIPDGEYTPTHT